MQILVVVAFSQIIPLTTEVDKGSEKTLHELGLVGPKVYVNSIKGFYIFTERE